MSSINTSNGIKKMKKFIIYLFVFLIGFFAKSSYSMQCPSNFNSIELGYKVSQVIELCGEPKHREEHKRTIRQSGGVQGYQGYGRTVSGYGNSSVYGIGGYNKLEEVKEKVIVVLKLYYGFPQPAVLIFNNGILVDKQYLN